MIYLYGASGHGKVIAEIVESRGDHIAGIFDDDHSKSLWDIPFYIFPGPFNDERDELIISIGDNSIRKKIASKLQLHFHTAIDSTAKISTRSIIGAGTVIMAGVIINADVTVGEHCIINTAAVIEHDCVLGNFVHVSPNATLCGNVTIGEGTHIGAGSVIIQGKKIGSNSIIGAGAVVINDIPDNVVAVGNPARVIKSINNNGKNLPLATAYGRK